MAIASRFNGLTVAKLIALNQLKIKQLHVGKILITGQNKN